jgi:hypothetical protein
MKDLLVGLLTGIAAVIATALLAPRRQPPELPIRQLAPIDDQDFSKLGREYLPTSDPDRRKLEQTTASLKVSSASLETVVKQLADASGQNFYVDWAALYGAGIGATDTVTLDLHSVPLSVLLNLTLKEVGGEKARLGYRVIDGVVHVSTAENLRRYTVTRIYNVRDLVEKEIAWSAKNVKNNLAPAAATDSLVQLIQQSLEPYSWRDAGGTTGAIHAFGGLLVVTQTPETQDAILGMLAALRRSDQPWPTSPPTPTQGR